MRAPGRWVIALLVIWTGLAFLFAFTDLQISRALYDPAAAWGRWIEAYGQVPGALVSFACGNLLLRLYRIEKSARSIAGVIVLVILLFGTGLFLLADVFGEQTGSRLDLRLIAGLELLLILAVQALLRRIPSERLAPFKPAARVGFALVFVAGLLTVWAIKIPWGRWRYRELLAAGDLARYSPWYLPQGFNGHYSFISGHAAMVFCVLPVLLFFKPGSPARAVALVVILLWGLIGSLGRMVVGAHFASDVLFGGCEAILWFLLMCRWFKVDF